MLDGIGRKPTQVLTGVPHHCLLCCFHFKDSWTNFPPVSQDLIRGISISGHLVMLQSEKITYLRL